MAESVSTSNRALFVNCLRKDSPLFENLLTEFTGDGDCSKQLCYVWSVNNKYYSAQISLRYFHLDGDNVEVDDSYEAVVIVTNGHFPNESSSIAAVWADICKRLGEDSLPAVCILVAVLDSSHNMSDLQGVLQWCVKNGFEMIKWRPEGKQKDEEEEEELDGTARLAEALQAHVWPVMTMKGGGKVYLPQSVSPQEPSTATALESTELELESTKSTKCTELSESKSLCEDDQLLAMGLDGEQDPGCQSFEDLFARFADMKVHAQQLSHEERKDYAEKVVLAFWNAIGGDEDEVKEQ